MSEVSPEPFWSDGQVTVHLGDCLDVLAGMDPCSIDACVTDPPYALADLPAALVAEALAAWVGGDRGYVPAGGRGFMGRDWDKFVPPPAAWDACMRVLKPGGHLLAFAAPRTLDLMGISVRLAGFEIRDGIDWIFGQGYPKNLDVSKEIDKQAGRTGQSVSALKARMREAFETSGMTRSAVDAACGFRASNYLTLPAEGKRPDPWVNVLPSPEKWAVMRRVLSYSGELDELFEAARREVTGTGHRIRRESTVQYAALSDGEYDITAPATDDAARWDGFGTALKPAHEPVIVARKPLAGTVAANVLTYGTGALNIDGCRVGSETRLNNAGGVSSLQRVSRAEHGYRPTVTRSRNEASEVDGRWPPNVVFFHASGCIPVGVREVRASGHHPSARGPGGISTSGHTGQEGLAERRPRIEPAETWDCVPGCPVRELDQQTRAPGRESYGDSGGASRFFPVFRYDAKAGAAERPRLDDGTAHPTVKPLPFMRFLVRLVTPPGGLVADPFAGTGTTGEACIIEGFRCVLIERDPKSADLIMERLRKPIQPDLFGGAA